MNAAAPSNGKLNRSWKRRQSPRHRGRAFGALHKLMVDKENTTQVFEVMRARSGHTRQDNYPHLLAQPDGGRIAHEHVELSRN